MIGLGLALACGVVILACVWLADRYGGPRLRVREGAHLQSVVLPKTFPRVKNPNRVAGAKKGWERRKARAEAAKAQRSGWTPGNAP